MAVVEENLVFFINGIKNEVVNPDPEMTLITYLRLKLGLTGTKLGCSEGGCGACTVMISRYSLASNSIQHYSVNACLAPLCSMHGLAVTTVEGIGSLGKGLHPVQERIASAHGSQCGFCTPGFVMSMYTLLRNYPHPTSQQLESAFDGNLCRCTGYRSIIEGYRAFVQGVCEKGSGCCRACPSRPNDVILKETDEKYLIDPQNSKKLLYDPSQELIFPPYLKAEGISLHSQSLCFRSQRVTWHRPTTLQELLAIKAHYPNCKFVIGNTEIGIETKFKKLYYPVMVAATHIKELLLVEYTDMGIRFGSSVTLATLEKVMKEAVEELPEYKTRIFSAFVEMLRWFAGYQIRNVAALGGNIMTASPISDLNPLLLACNATLELCNTDGVKREVQMDSRFFLGYRKTAVEPSEILVSVLIPFSEKNEYFCGYKQANRKEDDISIVNAGMRVVLDDNCIITNLSLAFGGMAPITVMATKTSNTLIGHKWNEELVSLACQLLAAEMPLDQSAPGGMVQYRRSLTLSFFFKFYLMVLQQLHHQKLALEVPLRDSERSAFIHLERELPQGSQVFEAVSDGQSPEDALHRPLVHHSAYKQASGEAIYQDDIPISENELFAGFVLSSEAHAKLISVDPTEALGMEGVHDFISYLDVPSSNYWGAGEEVFASKEVVNKGQVIGVILAKSLILAQRAAAAVNVKYEKLESIITIKEAITKNSYFLPNHEIINGNVEAGFAKSDRILEGEIHIEAQEHFYMECQGCLVRPGEDGEMEVIATNQGPAGLQQDLSKVLGVPQNKLVVRTKRLGMVIIAVLLITYVYF